jgi:hypothetical protein
MKLSNEMTCLGPNELLQLVHENILRVSDAAHQELAKRLTKLPDGFEKNWSIDRSRLSKVYIKHLEFTFG